ncbi:expressed unknown protein [Seminavis robusta]|uniref:Uncharacterized protein n=1 Tax=Seminavis robusta TaxID=568900 RepID=A0A9N8EDK8_9STRA|nr:expressed unknown protein [Seminavis robusta]|eukprot:Sro968_g225970.1 n/a (258) ;mRNA; f:12076-12849
MIVFPSAAENETSVSLTASEIQAIFPNGVEVNFTSHDIRVLHRPSSDVLILQQGDHMVRLYLTTPEWDWRHNVTTSYSWQLSMAWMSGPSTDIAADGWLYWNRENTINSQVQAKKALLSADSVTLHFREPAQRMSKWGFGNNPPPETKIVLKDVLMGAQAAESKPFRPCSLGVCEIVDGVVVTSDSVAEEAFNLVGGSKGMITLLAILSLVVLGLAIGCAKRRKKTTAKYSPIGDDTEADSSNDDADESGEENETTA